MDSFEKHLRDHKAQLDLDQVNPEVWLSIENKVLQQKNKHARRRLRWISSVAAMLLLGLLFQFYWYQSTTDPLQLLAQQGLVSSQLTQQVSQKTQALAGAIIPVHQKENFDLLVQQLAFLDKQYHDYLQYIQENGYQAFIGQQILNYYQTKIQLLDKIQQEIEKVNYYETKYDKASPKVELHL